MSVIDHLTDNQLTCLALILRDALRCDGVIGPSDRDKVEKLCNQVLDEEKA